MIIIPKFWTLKWRRQFGKISDLLFEIPVRSVVWKREEYEPHIYCIYLPLSITFYWRYENREITVGLGWKQLGVYKMPGTHTGTVLYQL